MQNPEAKIKQIEAELKLNGFKGEELDRKLVEKLREGREPVRRYDVVKVSEGGGRWDISVEKLIK